MRYKSWECGISRERHPLLERTWESVLKLILKYTHCQESYSSLLLIICIEFSLRSGKNYILLPDLRYLFTSSDRKNLSLFKTRGNLVINKSIILIIIITLLDWNFWALICKILLFPRINLSNSPFVEGVVIETVKLNYYHWLVSTILTFSNFGQRCLRKFICIICKLCEQLYN